MEIILIVLLGIIVILIAALVAAVSISNEFIRRTAMYLDNLKKLRDMMDNILFKWMPQDNRGKVIEDYLIDHGYCYPCIYDMRKLGKILYEAMQEIEQGVFACIDKRNGQYCMLDEKDELMDSKISQKADIVIVADQYVSKTAKDNIQKLVRCPVVSLGEIIEEQSGKMDIKQFEKKVSVIVPVYNTEKYLPECIDSLLNQTLGNVEIILINDGSSDNSGEIIDKYARKYSNVIALHQKNQKQGAVRNYGLSVAKGEYIAYIDSDDYLTQDALERLYDLARKRRLDAISYDAKPFFEEGVRSESVETLYDRSNLDIDFEKVWRGSDYWNENYRKGGAFINPCFMFCRREFLQQNNFEFQPNVFYEDNEFGMKIYLCAKRFMCLPEKFYCRRYRADSTMTGEVKTIHLISRLISAKCIWKHIIHYADIVKQSNASYTFFSSNLNKVLNTLEKVEDLDGKWFTRELLVFNDFIWHNEDILLENYEAKVMNPVVDFFKIILQDERLKKYFETEDRAELEKTVHISDEIERRKLHHVFEGIGISEEQKICIYGTGKIGKRVSNIMRNLLEEHFQEHVFYAQTSVTEEIYDGCRVLPIDAIGNENVGLVVVATTKYTSEMLHTVKKLYDNKYNILTYEELMNSWGK